MHCLFLMFMFKTFIIYFRIDKIKARVRLISKITHNSAFISQLFYIAITLSTGII